MVVDVMSSDKSVFHTNKTKYYSKNSFHYSPGYKQKYFIRTVMCLLVINKLKTIIGH